MTADETDVHDTVLILDGCDQPVPIPLDIENHTVVSNKAGIAISVLDFRGGVMLSLTSSTFYPAPSSPPVPVSL